MHRLSNVPVLLPCINDFLEPTIERLFWRAFETAKLEKMFLVGAFLKKRVDYSHCFLSVFFDTPEVTKIVLPKVLQNFLLYLLDQGTGPKRFFLFPRNIQYRARLEGPPFQFFSGLRDFFFGKKFSPNGELFWSFATDWMLKNPKGSPFSVFGIETFFKKIWCCRREYFDTLKSFCYFWALDMAPTWAGPGLFFLTFAQSVVNFGEFFADHCIVFVHIALKKGANSFLGLSLVSLLLEPALNILQFLCQAFYRFSLPLLFLLYLLRQSLHPRILLFDVFQFADLPAFKFLKKFNHFQRVLRQNLKMDLF